MVQFNLSMGNYKPHFFNNQNFALSRVDFISDKRTEHSALTLLSTQHSFSFIREKIRHIDAYDLQGNIIPFDKFLSLLKIKITSNNHFKVGKYLSRIFRPTKFGSHFNKLNIHINQDTPEQLTDGISLISQKLAHQLGWKAEPYQSAQFTLFSPIGLVKGHCIVSNKIQPDIVIYSGNVKEEIKFEGGIYVALEPVKLSDKVNMDIQSLINFWYLFGGEQFFDWFIRTVDRFKSDLLNGKLNQWLDDLNELEPDDEPDDRFTLQNAIRHNIDYRKFPGLMRSAWNVFYKSLVKTIGKENAVNFRIPIPNAFRAYLRVDLRAHNEYGDFSPLTKSVCLDEFGNLWVAPEILPQMFKILGGADQDDSVVIIPIKDGDAIIYRNPNQFGEYQKLKLEVEKLAVKFELEVKELIPCKEVVLPVKEDQEEIYHYKNPYLEKYLSKVQNHDLPYNKFWLSRTIVSTLNNESNIGFVANAEMIMNSVRMIDRKMFEELKSRFNWNLEKIIDSAIKDNEDVSNEINKVYKFYDYCAENEVPIPLCLEKRIPERYRDKVAFIEDHLHPLDELYSAMVKILDLSNKEIIGEGIAGKDRIPGLIDLCEPPVEKVLNLCHENPYSDYAIELMKRYNRSVAVLLESVKDLSLIEKNKMIEEGIDKIQSELRDTLKQLTEEERLLIIQQFVLSTYVFGKNVHDSILWNKYIANDVIKLLIYAGEGKEIKIKDGKFYRDFNKSKVDTDKLKVRVWSKEELKPEMLSEINEVLILDRKVICGQMELNLGDEVKISEGVYKIEAVSYAYSKKNNRILKNSLTLIVSPEN